ncbi:hypothetical protein OIU76_004869 [Salix suchowensis]|nr:hypothetical protein OIU76_004869 [Salix suchowensis]
MATRKLLQTFKKTPITASPASLSNSETAQKISKTLIRAGLKPFETTDSSLLSNLDSHITNLVFSNPNVPLHSCLNFFNFLRKNQSFVSQKPDLQSHLSVVFRLFKARRFAEMKRVLTYVAMDSNLRCPVANLVSLVEESGFNKEPNFVEKLCDMLFRVYADCNLFEEGFRVFDYMVSYELKIDDRSCIVFLLALKRCDKMEACLGLFKRMVEFNVEVTVYSLTIVIDGLCKRWRVKRAKDLMIEMASKGIKPNVVTYNTLINAYIKRNDFEGVNEMLRLMEVDKVEYNAATYTLLIDWHGSSGAGHNGEERI